MCKLLIMFQSLPRVYAINKSRQYVQRQPIFTSDVDHDYIIEKIKRQDHIEYKRQIQNDDKQKYCI